MLHLILATLRSTVSLTASLGSKNAWPWSNATVTEEVNRILARLRDGDAEHALSGAVLQKILRDDADLIHGIAAYRRHPWRRRLQDPAVVWTEGQSRLLDFGGHGPPVLFVPSLVNRAYILDLGPGMSMLRWLATQGLRPLLLDWGWPDAVERQFTLTDYVAGRLSRAIDAVGQLVDDQPLVLAGYCLGGMLATAAAAARSTLRGLAVLATPWDYHAGGSQPMAEAVAAMLPLLEPALVATGTLPIDALQTLFAMIDPFSIAAKYRSFGRLHQSGPQATRFVAIEDWLNDGVPLPAPVARETLGGWYGANNPARRQWRIAGLAVDPGRILCPALAVIPNRDRIVPPSSAAALADALPLAARLIPEAGHVGMIAGANAEAQVWRPLRDWIHALPPA
jgi:poly(3-hydroxyalkanoate) synthetase